jgi:hypothetical protein
MVGSDEEGNTPRVKAMEMPMDTEDGADLVRDGTDGVGGSLSRVSLGASPLPVSALPEIDKMDLDAQVEDTVRGQLIGFGGQKPLTDRCVHAWQADR